MRFLVFVNGGRFVFDREPYLDVKSFTRFEGCPV